MLENGDIKRANLCEDEMPLLEDCSEVDIEEEGHSDLLVIRRILNIQPKDDREEK